MELGWWIIDKIIVTEVQYCKSPLVLWSSEEGNTLNCWQSVLNHNQLEFPLPRWTMQFFPHKQGGVLSQHINSASLLICLKTTEKLHQYQEATLALLNHTDKLSQTDSHTQCLGEENCSLWVYDVNPCVFGAHTESTVHSTFIHAHTASPSCLCWLYSRACQWCVCAL